MEREDIENSLKVLSHIVDDDFIITVDEARKIIGIDGETIEALQAEVERLQARLPKRGEWEREMDVNDEPFYQCSVCGECFDFNRDSTHEVFKYCPDCGAKMEVQDAEM